MVGKAKLIDVSKCTGCRSCQVACKQWNRLPAGVTTNSGTYQNPPDLQANTWTLVRFQEIADTVGGVKWLFRKDGCLHCTEAACEKVCPVGARAHLDYGAVTVAFEKCIGCQSCVTGCPFGKPRFSKEANKVYNCNLCPDKIQAGLSPACVKACPTGALKFGDQEAMLNLAYRRVKELGGDASVYGDTFFGGTHVIYVLEEKVIFYDGLPAKPQIPSSIVFRQDLFAPVPTREA